MNTPLQKVMIEEVALKRGKHVGETVVVTDIMGEVISGS